MVRINDIIGTDAQSSAQTGENSESSDSFTQSESLEKLEPLNELDGPGSELLSRIELLSAAIEHRPDAPSNYVLRGEMLLDGGDDDLAASDFNKALELAEYQAETANWGYIYRALADRARQGLRRARA